jgi:hypothetical protein
MLPIPTTYKGQVYRSRLEARWALFFEKIDVVAHYEVQEIFGGGLSYLPDFIVNQLIWRDSIIAEIKPIIPNQSYIDYLCKIRKPGLADFFVFVGEPSFIQPTGVWIYGINQNIVQRGFSLGLCHRCGYYGTYYQNFNIYSCRCNYRPPNPNWQRAAAEVSLHRFDL